MTTLRGPSEESAIEKLTGIADIYRQHLPVSAIANGLSRAAAG
jgi:hypothetical protein